jgi:very-short-patch-repair endonuclease
LRWRGGLAWSALGKVLALYPTTPPSALRTATSPAGRSIWIEPPLLGISRQCSLRHRPKLCYQLSMVTAPKPTIKRARQLRADMSLPEVMLWNFLRQRPNGLKFRRQHPVGAYILDFYCLERRIAIEIDGIAHDMGHRPARDAARDAWLMVRRISVIRIAAKDVLTDVDAAAQSVVDLITSSINRIDESFSP